MAARKSGLSSASHPQLTVTFVSPSPSSIYQHTQTYMHLVVFTMSLVYRYVLDRPKPSTSIFIKINKAVQCAVCALLPPLEKASLCRLTSFPAALLLHLNVRFYVLSQTAFPTKMAALRNSPSSLSQHDLLMCVYVRFRMQ